MSIEIKVPELPESIADATIAAWYKKPGEQVMQAENLVDIETKKSKLAHKERTDSCSVPAASIVAEAMLCFVLADAMLEKFGGDSIDQLKSHIQASGKY